jgi:hypothetical protein
MGGNNNKTLTLSIHKLLSSQSCACLLYQTTTKYIIPENTLRRGVGSRNFLVRLRGPNLRPPPRNTKKKHAPTKREGKTGYTCERKKRTRQTSTPISQEKTELQNSDQNKPQKPKAAAATLPQNNASPKEKDESEGRRERRENEKGRRRLNHGSIPDTNCH